MSLVCRAGHASDEPDYCSVCGAPIVVGASPAPARRWELVITVDEALDTDPDPAHPCPTSAPPRVLAINRREMLVGRHDNPRDIHPEVPLFDPGVSRRHAKLMHEADGGVAFQDLASTNGSQLNGKEVRPGMQQRLVEGDVVTLGRWTRITLRARR